MYHFGRNVALLLVIGQFAIECSQLALEISIKLFNYVFYIGRFPKTLRNYLLFFYEVTHSDLGEYKQKSVEKVQLIERSVLNFVDLANDFSN
jgi:hypothetical protein